MKRKIPAIEAADQYRKSGNTESAHYRISMDKSKAFMYSMDEWSISSPLSGSLN
jgi:hypothetical protein